MRKSNLFLKAVQVASLTTLTTLSVSVSAEPVANPNVSCPEGTQLVAKFNWEEGYIFEKPVGNEGIVTVTGNASAGSWTATIPVSAVILKGATGTHQYTTNSNRGSFSYLDLPLNKGGRNPAISNVQFCAPKVPQICQEWDFVKDSFTDGTAIAKTKSGGWITVYGGNEFEIYGMALKQQLNQGEEDEVLVAINTNIPLVGNDLSEYIAAKGLKLTDNLIGLGDLILNFGGVKYGVHFTNNDAGVKELGVYANITTKDVTSKNIGWPSLGMYRDYVNNQPGKTASLGDVSFDEGYFNLSGNYKYGQIVIDSGTKIADIQMLESDKLPDFAAIGANGKYTHGFKFKKVKSMVGDATVHIFTECFNDGVAIKTNIAGSCKPLLGDGLSDLTATAGQDGVTLSWQVTGNDIASLNVYRAEMGADGKYVNITKIAEGLGDANTYTDVEVAAGTTYYYAVEQISFKAAAKFSEVVSAVAQ